MIGPEVRVCFTIEQEDELWERWRRGEPSRLIARSLRTHPSTVRGFLSKHGGIRPPTRRRSAHHLTVAEREEVSRSIAAGSSSRAIAAKIGRSPSTVSREIARNGGRAHYRAMDAEQAAWDRGRRPQREHPVVESRAAQGRA
jgi:IS30 family transposase